MDTRILRPFLGLLAGGQLAAARSNSRIPVHPVAGSLGTEQSGVPTFILARRGIIPTGSILGIFTHHNNQPAE